MVYNEHYRTHWNNHVYFNETFPVPGKKFHGMWSSYSKDIDSRVSVIYDTSYLTQVSHWWTILRLASVALLHCIQTLRPFLLLCSHLRVSPPRKASLNIKTMSQISKHIYCSDVQVTFEVNVNQDLYRSFIPNKPTFIKPCLAQWMSKLCNPLNKVVPGQFHGSGGYSKRNCLQNQANSHKAWAWQIILILMTVTNTQFMFM